MEILLWLVPAVAATLVAMAVAGWVGRERADAVEPGRSERLPGEIVGRPDEGVSAARPLTATGADTESDIESATSPVRSAQRPPAPPARRSA